MPHLSAPLFDFPEEIPYQGKTVEARQASLSGARVAQRTWSTKQARILQVLRKAPHSRQQLHELTGIPINAVCSLVADLVKAGHVESNGDYETKQWTDGSLTKRERFRVTR